MTCQVTALLERFEGKAANCTVVNTLVAAGFGDTVMLGVAAITVTIAVPDFVVSACDVAITVTWAGFGTVAGAV